MVGPHRGVKMIPEIHQSDCNDIVVEDSHLPLILHCEHWSDQSMLTYDGFHRLVSDPQYYGGFVMTEAVAF